MMDNHKELIERLRTESLYKDKATLEIMDLCMEAADALSVLQVKYETLAHYAAEKYTQSDTMEKENAQIRAELEQAKEKNAGLALALLYDCNPNEDCLGENEWSAIRSELEQVKRDWIG